MKYTRRDFIKSSAAPPPWRWDFPLLHKLQSWRHRVWAPPFVTPFEAKGVYFTKRLSASVSKNLRRGVHPKARRTIRRW